MVCTKIETKFLGNVGNLKVFSAQNQVVSKKNKNKKKVFTDFETDLLAEISNSKVFFAQNQVVSKKRKRSSPILRLLFGTTRNSKRLREGCFTMGGLFSNFHPKSTSNPPKRFEFAYFTSQWGSSPPTPPWLRYCSSPNFGQKLGPNLIEDLF